MRSHTRAGTRFDEAGDTLIEILVAVTITSLAVVGILGALLTTTSSSISHRNMTTFGAVLKSFAETVRNAIETQQSPSYTCPVSSMYKIAGPLVPSSGPPGTPIAALGTGFPAAGTYAGRFNGALATWTAGPNPSTSGAVATYTVPNDLAAGTYTADPFDATTAAGSDFTVTPWVGAVTPQTPGVVGSGSKITFAVQGFAATKGLNLTLGTSTSTNVATTGSNGSASVTFTIPAGVSGVVHMTVSDAAGNSAPAVLLNLATDTADKNPIPATSALSQYQLTSTVSYWTGSTGALTLTKPTDSSPLWSTNYMPNPSTNYCVAPNGNLELLGFRLFSTQSGQAGGEYFSVVVGNPNTLNETSTSLAPTSQTVTIAQPAVFTATVSVVTGTGTPTGNVAFFDNGTAISSCGGTSGTAMTGTSAVCTIPAGTYSSAGTHSITALYLGDSNFRGSMTTSSATLTVIKLASVTSAPTSNNNPAVAGQTVTYSASVTPTSPTPTGFIEFFDGGTPIAACGGASGVAMTGTSASCTTSYASQGTHTITATYLGDGNYNASATSGPLIEVIKAASNISTPTSNANPAVVGQTVTYSASVTPTSPTPTGFIEFFDGGTPIAACGGASGVAMTGTSANCAVSYATTGTHTITAQYLGDANYGASAVSSPLTEQVKLASSVTLSVSPGSTVPKGTQVTYTATVSPTTPTPNGNVEFLDGGVAIATCGGATGVPVSAAQATCSVTYNSKGTHTITVQYLGDTNYAPSPASAPLTEKIT